MQITSLPTESTGFINLKYRKEDHFHSEITAITRDFETPVTVRFYTVNGGVWYCCAWIRGEDIYVHAQGKAGGYGYHKPSAAFADAMRSAGIRFDSGISGRRDSAINEAVEALARKVTGKRKFFLHYSHG
jgi:hypothetical protein